MHVRYELELILHTTQQKYTTTTILLLHQTSEVGILVEQKKLK